MRPRAALRSELYRVLDADLSVPVYVQKVQESEAGELVMIEAPSTPKRGDLKEDTGHQMEQEIRVHTRFPKGKADVGRRDELAENTIDALNSASFSLTDHRLVHWPKEPHDTTPLQYDAEGGETAMDLLLTYNLYTQIR